MSVMSDDELWEFLQYNPDSDGSWQIFRTKEVVTRSEGLVSSEWKAWAKTEILSATTPANSDYLFRLLRVCRECYTHALPESVCWHRQSDGIEKTKLLTLFSSGEFLCGMTSDLGNTYHGEIAFANGTAGLIVQDVLGDGYVKLGIAGRKRAETLGGQVPPFFEIDILLPLTTQGKPEKRYGAKFPKPEASASATALAFGGDGGNANVINAPTLTTAPVAKTGDITQKVTVNPIDLTPLVEIERVKQEYETKRLAIALAASKGVKPEDPPTSASDVQDGYTVAEFTEFVSTLLKGQISEGTAVNILKNANVGAIGKRNDSKGRPDIYPRAEAEKAGREYVEKKKRG